MATTTGDMKNNLSKVIRESQRMKLPVEPNIKGLSLGLPSAYLPLLHAALMSYSLPLAQYLAEQGLKLYGRNDLRFVEGFYKVMRDVFQYRPQLTKEQFLAIGFAERKLILTYDILKQCQKKHHWLNKAQGVPNGLRTSRDNTRPSVHTIAGGSGIGSVWQENPITTVTVVADKAEHSMLLPLSPPPSPLNIPTAAVTTKKPQLDLTPPLSPLGFVTDNNSTVTLEKENKRPTKHVHIQTPPTNGRGPVATTYVSTIESDIGGSVATSNDITTSDDGTPHLALVCTKLQELSLAVEALSGRMTLLETRVKLVEQNDANNSDDDDDDDDDDRCNAATQTDATVPQATPLITTPIPVTPSLITSSSSSVTTPIYTPIGQRTARTPDQTKMVIERLKRRAEQTKDLLSQRRPLY